MSGSVSNRVSSGSIPRMGRSGVLRFASITFSGRPEAKWEEEQRQFLHERLRLFGPILVVLALLVNVRVLGIFGIWQRLSQVYSAGMLMGTLLAAAYTALLYTDRQPSLRKLRRLEILLLSALSVTSFFWCY